MSTRYESDSLMRRAKELEMQARTGGYTVGAQIGYIGPQAPQNQYNVAAYGEMTARVVAALQWFPQVGYAIAMAVFVVLEDMETGENHYFSKETWWAYSLSLFVVMLWVLTLSFILKAQEKGLDRKYEQRLPPPEVEPWDLTVPTAAAGGCFGCFFYIENHLGVTSANMNKTFALGVSLALLTIGMTVGQALMRIVGTGLRNIMAAFAKMDPARRADVQAVGDLRAASMNNGISPAIRLDNVSI